MSSLILHPETLVRRQRIERLRRQLTAVFDERVKISFEVFPKLRDRYAELFGEIEQQIQERTLEMGERRRMVELFALKLDRGQKLDVQTVELVMKAVRGEYSRVRGRMQQAFSDARRKEIDDAWQPSPFAVQQREAIGGTARRRADELRELYRFLAKRLHPDAQPDAGELARHYWDLVQKGYLHGDLPLLRTLVQLIETLRPRGTDRGDDLQSEEHRLVTAVRTERAQMEALQRDELYRMRYGMDDEEWVAERNASLEADLQEIEDEIAKCDRFLAPILSGQKAPPPEIVQSIWSSFVEDMYINHR